MFFSPQHESQRGDEERKHPARAGEPPKADVCKGQPVISRVTSYITFAVIYQMIDCVQCGKTNSSFRLINRGNYTSGTIF